VRDAMRCSVVIPTFNRAGPVSEAIESALAQTHAAHEVIVVDDGSTDGTARVLSSFGERIIVASQANGGVSSARNAGIALATSEWIAFLDSDDVWLPHRLATAARDLGSTDAGVHVADLVLEGAGYSESLLSLRGIACPSECALRDPNPIAKTVSGLSLNSIVCKRTWIGAAGGFDTSLRMFEDLDLLTRLAVLGPWLFTSDVVCHARRLVEAPGLALTDEALRHRVRTCEGHVSILERLTNNPHLLPEDRPLIARRLSGAHLAAAEAYVASATWNAAARHLVQSVRTHPSALKAGMKAAAQLAFGARGLSKVSGRGNGFYRESAEHR